MKGKLPQAQKILHEKNKQLMNKLCPICLRPLKEIKQEDIRDGHLLYICLHNNAHKFKSYPFSNNPTALVDANGIFENVRIHNIEQPLAKQVNFLG